MYATNIGRGSEKMSVLYLGSHNFSKAAWGVAGNQPTNVEVGVVLVTTSASIDQQWRDCLPCSLPGEFDESPEYYVPAKASETVKQLYRSGLVQEAERVFTNEMTKSSSNASAKVKAASNELIDRCDSD